MNIDQHGTLTKNFSDYDMQEMSHISLTIGLLKFEILAIMCEKAQLAKNVSAKSLAKNDLQDDLTN